MADKEATIYVIDVGKSMGRKENGREETNLEWSMQYVWDKITTTVSTGRKLAGIGVVGLRTDETNNELDTEDCYQNISVIQNIKQTLMSDVRHLRDEIRPSKTNNGDPLSAIVIAIQMIVKHCRKLKFIRRIILVTDGTGSMDADDLDEITSKIKEDGIELVILGVDFDDPEFGFKEENKDPIKKQNEKALRRLADECNGLFGTMAQAVSELGVPRLKSTKPVTSYKGLLTLGNPEKYDSAMCIDIERYPKVRVATAPTASNFVVKSDMAPGTSSTQTSATVQNGENEHAGTEDGLAAVKNARTYQVEDSEAPGGKRDVERDDLAKGYEYGRTAVHISESDANVVRMETRANMDIVGFVPKDKYEQYMNMSNTNIIVGNKANDKANMALSSLAHALYELDTYAIARFVIKDGHDPRMLLLAPLIEPDFECLIDVELPFAEDVRSYTFPPLDKVITVGGKKIIQHRNLPSDNLMKAMSDYVDAMDITTFGHDNQGIPVEYAAIDDTYSVKLHRINQAIKFRAVNPTDEVPPPSEILMRYSKPPGELLTRAQKLLDTVIEAADVKKVPPKQKGRKRTRDIEKPLSGLNVDELLGREKRARITAENAVPEFKQLLATTEELSAVKDAAKQMSNIIQGYIRHSVGDSGYGRAVEAIRVMKEEMTELEEPGIFNDVMRELKKKLLVGELGGDRKEMWFLIRVNRLGLISTEASDLSNVSPEEANVFLSAK